MNEFTDSRAASPLHPPRPDTLVVPPDWLETHRLHPGVRVVDMREERAYRAAHVPGAVHLALQRLGTSQPGLENVLLGPEPFGELMEALGISSVGTVVAYDDQWGLAAARLVWALHRYGHQAVTILDGGWDRWREEGRPADDVVPDVPRGRFEPRSRDEVAATRQWLLAARAEGSDVVLVDTRTEGEFGQGHLPGAKLWDWFSAVPAAAWDFSRPVAELREEWSALGATAEREVVVYCRSGMRAAHTYVALRRAGYDRVRLYDGSWQEWSMGENAPKDGHDES